MWAVGRMNKGGRPHIYERPPLYVGAVGKNLDLFVFSFFKEKEF